MKRRTALLAAAAVCVLGYAARGEYAVWDRGEWPESWPKDLDGLRKEAKTYEGPAWPDRRYLIRFTRREDFEVAWPHLLKVKTKGSPIILVRGPKTDFFKVEPAGVLIQTPPVANAGERGQEPGDTVITLVVDGKIVDLNRLELPRDTLIVDERFGK